MTAVLAVVLALALAGCSDDAEPPRAAPTPTSTPATTSASASASPTAVATGTSPATPPASAAPPATTSAAPPPASASARPSRTPGGSADPAQAARLTGDGLDLPQGVVPFGTSVAAAVPALTRAFGRPTLDTGTGSSFGRYGTCPGTQLRVLEWGGGALQVLFGDVPGPGLAMYAWRLTSSGSPAGLPKARALVGDVTTVDIGLGTTVTALRDAAGAAVEITAGDEVFGPSFRLQDQSAGLFGTLTSAAAQGTVTSVQAGQPCGE